MTREQAKKTALLVCFRWERLHDRQQDWYYREYGIMVDDTPWYRSFGFKLKTLQLVASTIGVAFMSIFVQVVGHDPNRVGIDSVNWFYVAVACLVSTLSAVRAFTKP